MATMMDLIRKLITQQSNNIGSAVRNIHGAAPGVYKNPELILESQWAYVELADLPVLAREEFYSMLAMGATATATLTTIDGVVSVPEGAQRVFLLRGMLHLPAPAVVPITFDVGGDTSAQFVIYKDGVKERMGQGALTVTLTLDAGTHQIEVICQGRGGTLTTPMGLQFTLQEIPPSAPMWDSLTTDYLDPNTGTIRNTLTWFSDPQASAWRIYRRTRTTLGPIAGVSLQSNATDFHVAITGDYRAEIAAGTQLFAGSMLMGVVREVSFDTNVTSALVRPVHQGSLLTLGTRDAWLGQRATVGTFVELGRVQRTMGHGLVTWHDTQVSAGTLYEYALQAVGMFDQTTASTYSEVRSVVAGDKEAPGPIGFLGPTEAEAKPVVVNKLVTARFHTPADTDYAGVRVYRRTGFSGTATGATSTTLTDTTYLWMASFVGATVRVTHASGLQEERTITAGSGSQLTVGQPWSTTPTVGSTYRVFRDVLLRTDYGLPDSDDQVTFAAEAFGEYQFRTFDIGGNEQSDESAVTWLYEAGDDTYVGPNQPPVISIRQVTTTDQANFSAPYNDTKRYSIIEIGGLDPEDGTAGVVLYYRTRGMVPGAELTAAEETGMPATAPATQWTVDAPTGTRSRYVAMDRMDGDGWIRVWAKDRNADETSLQSDVLTYSADYDDTPEFSSLETRIDNVNNTVTVSGVVDDDTRSFEWWVEPQSGTNPGPSSKAYSADLTLTKSFSFTLQLNDGERRTLKIQPFSGPTTGNRGRAGEVVSREFIRPPRTVLTFEDRDESGQISAARVKATFRMTPSPTVLTTGTVTAISGTTVTDTGKNFTATPYASAFGNQKFYVVRFFSTTGAPLAARLIKSHPASTQFVVEGSAPSTVTVGSTYQVLNGGVLFRLDQGEELPALDSEYFDRTAGRTVAFRAVLTDCPPEATQTVFVDADTVPVITGLSATVPSANQLKVQLTGWDDDVKYWRAYAKKGGWPTKDGTENGAVDSNYLRIDTTVQDASWYQHYVSGGTWYVIAIPTNSYNEDGPRKTTTCDVAAPASVGDLSSLAVAAHTTTANKVSWAHNSVAATSVPVHTVRVWTYRTDLGVGTEVELTGGTGRDVRLDAGVNTNNADDTDTTSNVGSYVHAGLPTRGTSSNTGITWRYTVRLYNAAGALVSTYQVDHFDYYVLSVPTLSSASVTTSDDGDCTNGCLQDMVLAVSWVSSNANDSQYQIDIDYSADASPSTWTTIVQGLPTASGTYYDTYPCHATTLEFLDAENMYKTYRVRMVRKADGVAVATQTTTTWNSMVKLCYW